MAIGIGGLEGELFNGELDDHPSSENPDLEVVNSKDKVVGVEAKEPPEALVSSVHVGVPREEKPIVGCFVEADFRNAASSGCIEVIPETLMLKPIVHKIVYGGAEDGEVLEGGSVSVDSELVKNVEDELEAVNADGAESVDSERRDAESGGSDEEGDGRVLLNPEAIAAVLRAFGASPNGITTLSSPALEPSPPGSSRPANFTPRDPRGQENDLSEEWRKFDAIRVKYLRIVQRLGLSPVDKVPAQLLNHLGLLEGNRQGRRTTRASIVDAETEARRLEASGEKDLNFSCNVLLLGKSGVGKSSTINSIFGEERCYTNASQPATASVGEISGTVNGVKIRAVDTPGLRVSMKDQATNRTILSSIKKYTRRCPPDVVLYVDPLTPRTQDSSDLHLLNSISSSLGSSLWSNAVIAFTHAATAPPDGHEGHPLEYEAYISLNARVVQNSIRLAADDMRVRNQFALVENHPLCQRVLPIGINWRSELLLMCYSSKILAEARSVLKLQDPPPRNLFGFPYNPLMFSFFLSSLLRPREHLKLLPTALDGEASDSDINLDDLSDADRGDEEDEYDQLPPFKPLRKSQIAKLTKEQKRAYYDEYDYRVKLFQKIQLKEMHRRLKEMKKKGKVADMDEGFNQDDAAIATAFPLPDLLLPPSFDSDNPVHHYRTLETTSKFLIRPLLDSQLWDHDCGLSAVGIEHNHAIDGRFPTGVSAQIIKDKEKFYIQLESSIAAEHGEFGSTLAGFDIVSGDKHNVYILRSETKIKSLKRNETTVGILLASFMKTLTATGLKIEDQILVGKRASLAARAGVVREQGDMAYQANLEARLRGKDSPIGQALTILGLTLMRYRGNLGLGGNLQSQIPVGRGTTMGVHAELNDRLNGKISLRVDTSQHHQIALVGILPLAVSILKSIWPVGS